MELKTTSLIRTKNTLVKKLKENFGEGAKEEEEDTYAQTPLPLTQGQQEDYQQEEIETIIDVSIFFKSKVVLEFQNY